jgi:hypothetical protein
MDSSGLLAGQAVVKKGSADAGTAVSILPVSGKGGSIKSIDSLQPGDRYVAPVGAAVLPRFFMKGSELRR